MFTKFAGFITVIAMALSGAVLLTAPAQAATRPSGANRVAAKPIKKAKVSHRKSTQKKSAQKKSTNKPNKRAMVAQQGAQSLIATNVGRVGPGSAVVMGERVCTGGFLLRSAGHYYLSVSVDCAGRALGESARIMDGGTVVATGSLRHTGVDDFALVEINAADGVQLDGSVPGWGGPVGVGTNPGAGDRLFLATPGGVRTGMAQAGSGAMTVAVVASDANRGAGLLNESGQAVGVISGHGEFLSLASALTGARAAGFGDLQLVTGGAFGTATVG